MNMVEVDVVGVVDLCSRFLPGMVERGTGAVLNVASTAAFQPLPGQAGYGAGKAFVLSYTQSLSGELRAPVSRSTVLCPGPVDTGFGEAAGFTKEEADDALPAFMWVTADRGGPDGGRRAGQRQAGGHSRGRQPGRRGLRQAHPEALADPDTGEAAPGSEVGRSSGRVRRRRVRDTRHADLAVAQVAPLGRGHAAEEVPARRRAGQGVRAAVAPAGARSGSPGRWPGTRLPGPDSSRSRRARRTGRGRLPTTTVASAGEPIAAGPGQRVAGRSGQVPADQPGLLGQVGLAVDQPRVHPCPELGVRRWAAVARHPEQAGPVDEVAEQRLALPGR